MIIKQIFRSSSLIDIPQKKPTAFLFHLSIDKPEHEELNSTCVCATLARVITILPRKDWIWEAAAALALGQLLAEKVCRVTILLEY